jgi:hypothetical protein
MSGRRRPTAPQGPARGPTRRAYRWETRMARLRALAPWVLAALAIVAVVVLLAWSW